MLETDLESALRHIRALEKTREDVIHKINEPLKNYIKKTIGDLAKNGGLNAIEWAQYTPYFNDGDTCVFNVQYVQGVHNDNITMSYDILHDNEVSSQQQAILDTEKILDNIGKEILKELFGDHVLVKITEDNKLNVEDYGHD